MSIPTFTPVTANKTIGSGNPPVDMNNIANELAALGGQYSVMNAAYAGGADPSGSSDSTSAIAATVAAASAAKRPVYIPAGTYKVSSTLNWKLAGLRVITDGAANVQFLQVSNNLPFLQLAGEAQQIIGGLTLKYNSQQTSSQPNSVGISFGDDSIGDSWQCDFQDLRVWQAATGLAINPSITTVAGLFSTSFLGITEVFGYSVRAVGLIGNAGGGAANCTGCFFENFYIHNNFTGSDADSTLQPAFFQAWDELVIEQLNIEHAQVFNSDAITFASVGSATINDLHCEHLEMSGTPGFGLVGVGSGVGMVKVNGLTCRFPTFTGASYNSIFRVTGGSGQYIFLDGLDFPSGDGGGNAVMPLVDFNSATNVRVRVDGIESGNQLT